MRREALFALARFLAVRSVAVSFHRRRFLLCERVDFPVADPRYFWQRFMLSDMRLDENG